MNLDDPGTAAVALIREAFDRARRAGKADWNRMTTAVLKNRLLQITNGDFSISPYGVRTVAEFAQLFPDVIRVSQDPNGGPAIVSLVTTDDVDSEEPLNAPARTRPARRPQVREDLWRATMDWNEGHAYVIDPITGRARLRRDTDSADTPNIAGVSKDLYLQWRSDFINEALENSDTQDDRLALEGWRDYPGPSRSLPTHLQDAWMERLRTLVIEHIRSWFSDVGLPAPVDLVRERAASEYAAVSEPTDVAVATQKLRNLVRRCVDQMSYDELRSLHLPAGVVARAFGR